LASRKPGAWLSGAARATHTSHSHIGIHLLDEALVPALVTALVSNKGS